MDEAIGDILLVCDGAGSEPFVGVGEEDILVVSDGVHDFLLEGMEIRG